MKEIIYRQLSKKKAMIFFIAYLTYFFIVLGFVLFSPFDILKLMNSTRTGVFPGLVGGLIMLWPLSLYAKLSILNKVNFDERKLSISSTDSTLILNYCDIAIMKQNIGTLSLYDANQRLLFVFRPLQDTSVLQKIITNVKKHVSFNVEKTNRKVIGGNIELQTYIRKDK